MARKLKEAVKTVEENETLVEDSTNVVEEEMVQDEENIQLENNEVESQEDETVVDNSDSGEEPKCDAIVDDTPVDYTTDNSGTIVAPNSDVIIVEKSEDYIKDESTEDGCDDSVKEDVVIDESTEKPEQDDDEYTEESQQTEDVVIDHSKYAPPEPGKENLKYPIPCPDYETQSVTRKTLETIDEKGSSNEKFFSFDKDEAKRYTIDRDKFIGFVLYRTIKIHTTFKTVDDIVNIKNCYKGLVAGLTDLIKTMNIKDVETDFYELTDENIDSAELEETLLFGTILIPYTGATSKYTTRIANYVKNAYTNSIGKSTFYIKCRSDVTVRADGANKIASNSIEGFIGMSRLDMGHNEDEPKLAFRSAVWLNESDRISYETICQANKYILGCGTKLNRTVPETHEQRYNTYRMRMRNCFFIVIYKLEKTDTGYELQRVTSKISIRIKKIFEEYIPIGIRMKTVEDKMEIVTMEDLLKEDGHDWLSSMLNISENNNYINGIKEDFNSIEKNILENL